MMDSDLQSYVEGFKEEVINMEVLSGFSPADLILKYAGVKDIDLIVMGTHGRRGLGYMFLGNIAQEVVRVAQCPVYTVRESEKSPSPKKTNVILTPVDFSDHSKAAISMAREVAGLDNAKLELLHVVKNTLHSAYNIFEEKTILSLQKDTVSRYQGEMKQIFDDSPGPDTPVEFKVVTGHVVSEILEYARCNNIGLIVISTHGATGLKRFLLGSVAEKVIRRAPCPVLTIKSFGKSLV